MIKIGITGGIFPPSLNRNIFTKKELCYVERDFANYWASFGVMPVLIPNLEEPFLPGFLSELDGLALMGGTDISPTHYMDQPILKWPGDPLRDAYELPILDWCFQKGLPIFGICRGFQLLNVYFGGTLYQDLPTEYDSKTAHASASAYDLNYHHIKVVQDELFDRLAVDRISSRVNSIHHQCVRQLADPLEVLAYSEDGLIEAFYHRDFPTGKIMGVQWHPEFFCHSKEPMIDHETIIRHFLSFC